MDLLVLARFRFRLRALLSHPFLAPLTERFISSGAQRRVAEGSAWMFAGIAGSRGFTFLASLLAARFLGTAGFGKLAAVGATIASVGAATSAISTSATYLLSKRRNTQPDSVHAALQTVEWFSRATSAFFALALLAAAPAIAARALGDASLTNTIRLSAAWLLLEMLMSNQAAEIAGFEGFSKTAKINVYSGALQLPAVAFGTSLNGLYGYIVAMICCRALTVFLQHREIARIAEIYKCFGCHAATRKDWAELLHACVPLTVSCILSAPVTWICTAMIVRQARGFDTLGLLNGANQFSVVAMYLATIAASVTLPVLSDLWAHGDLAEFRRTMNSVCVLNSAVTGIGALVGCVIAEPLMSLLGRGFTAGASTLRLLLIVAVILSVRNVLLQGVIAAGGLWVMTLSNVPWGLAMIGLTKYWVARGWGAPGCALASLVAHALSLVILAVWLRQKFRRYSANVPATIVSTPVLIGPNN